MPETAQIPGTTEQTVPPAQNEQPQQPTEREPTGRPVTSVQAEQTAQREQLVQPQPQSQPQPQPQPQQPEEPERPGQPAHTGSPGLGVPNNNASNDRDQDDDGPALIPFIPIVCPQAVFRQRDRVLPLVFDGMHNVAFVQRVDNYTHSPSGQPVEVKGRVEFRRVDAGGVPRILVETATSDESLPVRISAHEQTQTMQIVVPSQYVPGPRSASPEPCVEISATILVPRAGEINNLTVDAANLDVRFAESLSLRVAGTINITTVDASVGSGVREDEIRLSTDVFAGLDSAREWGIGNHAFVPAPASYRLDARVIKVATTSGRIHGNWPLFDVLNLRTISGEIGLSITPKEAAKADPKPAALTLRTASGTIQVAEPVRGGSETGIPARDYVFSVHSTSGLIRTALAFGGLADAAELSSTSGSIVADLLPVLDRARVTPRQPAQLKTSTTSGSSMVRVLEPLWVGDAPFSTAGGTPVLDRLEANHRSTSGSVSLRYPQSWEGDLSARTTSGTLRASGRDLRVMPSSRSWPRALHAHKRAGTGAQNASLLDVSTTSSEINVVIGDER